MRRPPVKKKASPLSTSFPAAVPRAGAGVRSARARRRHSVRPPPRRGRRARGARDRSRSRAALWRSRRRGALTCCRPRWILRPWALRAAQLLRAAPGLAACVALGDLPGEAQGAQRLVGVAPLLLHVDQHQRLAVAAQTGLHEMRQLGVAEGHVRATLRLGGEDVRQARKAFVDVPRLPEPVPCGAGSVQTLRTREVHKVQSAVELHPEGLARALEVHGKDGVRPRRGGVGIGGAHSALLRSMSHERVDLLLGRHVDASHTRDDGAPGLVLDNDVLARGRGVAPASQEVTQSLIVHLHEGSGDGPIPTRAFHVVGGLEDLLQGPGDQSRRIGSIGALHGVGLARARLAVRENGNLVAVEGGLDQTLHLLEHVELRALGPEDAVELEGVAVGFVGEADLVLSVHLQSGLYISRRGAQAAKDADSALQFLHLVVHLDALELHPCKPLVQAPVFGLQLQGIALQLSEFQPLAFDLARKLRRSQIKVGDRLQLVVVTAAMVLAVALVLDLQLVLLGREAGGPLASQARGISLLTELALQCADLTAQL
mmetsp:Transcript_99742/g.281584  ORF Transcript_99742/g.281584 Transcript_99742/m.281584 type:complete len:543 (-) Transcript_99742:224-1852(-)